MSKSSYELVNLQQYSYFNNREEMDRAVKEFNKELSKAHYRTLNMLKQYSCKTVGVCRLKAKTIAKTLEISERTVRRHIKYLQENGFITIIPISRPKTGGDGANAYAINSPLKRSIVLKSKYKNERSEVDSHNNSKNNDKSIDETEFPEVLVSKQTIEYLNSLKNSSKF